MRLLNWKSSIEPNAETAPALQATERMRQTLAAFSSLLDQAMNDTQSLDAEFQESLLQVARDATASLEEQTAERLKAAVEAAERKTRTQVTEELQARFRLEIAAAVEAVRNESAAQRVRPNQELERLTKAASEWERERSQLMNDREKLNQVLERSREEHGRALAENDDAAAIALERQMAGAVDRVRALWEAERAELLTERDRSSSDSLRLRREMEEVAQISAQLESECKRLRNESENNRRLLADSSREQARLSNEAAEAKAAAASTLADKAVVDVETLRSQISRVEELIQNTLRVIEDPETELSEVIRKNAERAELEAYLRGLRFVAPPKRSR
jgi:chromosome segregation ATPase